MTAYAKSVVKEAGRAAIAAYEDPANIEDLMFAVGLAAIAALESANERQAEEDGQRWHDEREAAAHVRGSWA
jgi:hypothetical protein